MFAASLLVVAVLAAYASLAMLSLTAVTQLPLGGVLGSIGGYVGKVGWQPPSVKDVVSAHKPSPSGGFSAGPLADMIDFGSSSGVGQVQRSVSITNTARTPLDLTVAVVPANTGLTATFQNGATTMTVRNRAKVTVSSSPMFAGPISGTLEITVTGSSLPALSIPLQGFQAPLPPTAVTATAAAGGAVDVSWAPSPSVGVSGYLVERSLGTSGAWQQVGGVTAATATTAVDQTSTDGSYSYRVVAEAPGVSGPLQSPVGPVASAVSDSTAPATPDGVNPPAYINAADGSSVTIPVILANDSAQADTITVKLIDGSGASVTGQASGGGASVGVSVPNLNKLAEGTIRVSATATDSVGNVSQPTATETLTKDTVAPDAPSFDGLPKITGANLTNVPISVTTGPADAGDVVTVQLSDGSNTVTATATESANQTSVTVTPNASSLSDGPVKLTATVTDLAGNISGQGQDQTTKDTTGPDKPASIGVAAGSDNPAGVVTAASQSAVIIQATFDQPPAADDTILIWAAGTSYPLQSDGQSSTLTLGPLDLSGLADGTYHVGIVLTDSDGNVTKMFTHFTKDTSGPTAPTSVSVPQGDYNPAGYVNAATQTAATIVAAFAAPTDPADQISLSVDGLNLAPQQGGSDTLFWTADLSGLPDGTLQILGTITDAAGVTTNFVGTLIKDTQAPPPPAAADVIGPPPDTINPANASCVKVGVAFNQAPDPADVVTVTLSDENTSVQGSAPAGDGQVTVGCIDASSLSDGNIAVNVTVTDAAGNSTSVAGTTATKVPCQHN